MMEIRPLEPRDEEAMRRFFGRIPEGDRTFFKEDVTDPAVLEAWTKPGAGRSVALVGDEVVGSVALVPLTGWSSHVAELRVVVDPHHRGRGIGRDLSRHAVLEALDLGLKKIVVEVVADQEPAIAMFRALGFHPEALLKDHIRDQRGELRDLMILAQVPEEAFQTMAAAGIAEAQGL
jgi:ribosomal protein S18 acetylase RimI-like enzyme